MEVDDVAAKLKELDAIDAYEAKLFEGLKKNQPPSLENKSTKIPIAQTEDNNFDDSDVDIDALLEDDDDIITKTIKSPEKSAKQTKSISSNKNVAGPKFKEDLPNTEVKDKVISPTRRKNDSSKDITLKTIPKEKSRSIDESDEISGSFKADEIKNSTFLKDSKLSLSDKMNVSKGGHFLDDETAFLDNLGLNQLSNVASVSNSETQIKSQVSEKNEKLSSEEEEDDDIDIEMNEDLLKDLGLDANEVKKNVKKNSPEHDTKKSILKNPENKTTPSFDKDNEKKSRTQILSNTLKENDNSTHGLDLQKRRESQVGFKDSLPTSPKNETTMSKSSISHKSSELQSRAKKLGAAKDTEFDWENLFSSSAKTQKPSETQRKKRDTVEKKESVIQAEHKSRRRSSSADWLGMNEDKSPSKSNVLLNKAEEKNKESNFDWLHSNDSPPSKTKDSEEILDQNLSKNLTDKLTGDMDWLSSDKPITTEKLDKTIKPKKTSDISFSQDIDLHSKENISILPETFGNDEILIKNQLKCDREKISKENLEKTIIPNTRAKSAIVTSKQIKDVQVSSNTEANTNEYKSLQLMLNNSLLEREHLAKSNETMKLMYEEQLISLETQHKTQLKTMEDSFRLSHENIKKEYEMKLHSLEQQLKLIENDKKQLETNLKDKVNIVENEHKKEIKRLKDLHSEAIAVMKQDHEDALNRLQKLKDQEIEAISSTQTHTRSLQYLTDQLEARATELKNLHNKVEEKNHLALREKQALLDTKEKDLKVLENRLQRQLQEGDEERLRLQQLVLRLESRLQKYTSEGEEDRWDMQQMKARLQVQKKYLDEEHKLNLEQVEREKEKLRLSQDSLLHEQKTVLLQLAQERQQLMQEKLDIESLAKKIREEEARLNVKKLREDSTLESLRQSLQKEQEKLHLETMKVKQEAQYLEREQESLQRDKQWLKEEKEKIYELKQDMEKKINDAEKLKMIAEAEKEQSHIAQMAARRIETEHTFRMEQFKQQMQMIMDKEHQLLLEKEKLSQEKWELEHKKESQLCHRCKLAMSLPVNVLPPEINQNGTLSTLNQNGSIPALNGISNRMLQPHTDPSLVVWYITAQKDQEFLQEELSFLRSLKDSGKVYK